MSQQQQRSRRGHHTLSLDSSKKSPRRLLELLNQTRCSGYLVKADHLTDKEGYTALNLASLESGGLTLTPALSCMYAGGASVLSHRDNPLSGREPCRGT
jgi:hypothetical protein